MTVDAPLALALLVAIEVVAAALDVGCQYGAAVAVLVAEAVAAGPGKDRAPVAARTMVRMILASVNIHRVLSSHPTVSSPHVHWHVGPLVAQAPNARMGRFEGRSAYVSCISVSFNDELLIVA